MRMSPRRVAVIPARGNSKGIPGKNLLRVAGRPLLDYTIGAARESGIFDEVVVSSESDRIREHAAALGATPVPRPAYLSADDVHSVHVVLDYLERPGTDPETEVCMLLPTSPLRTASDIVDAFEVWDSTTGESLVSVYQDNRHLLRFRVVQSDGLLQRLDSSDPNVQRQEMDDLFVVNGSIYISTAETLLDLGSFHLGSVVPFVMDRQASVDIDCLADVDEVERLLHARDRVLVA
jgi:CMP-N-acetylneuraminic acid synthetase